MAAVKPGRLAVRYDPEPQYPNSGQCYTIVSAVKLPGYSRSTTGRFPGLWCCELYGWDFTVETALLDARVFADRLAADAAMAEQCS